MIKVIASILSSYRILNRVGERQVIIDGRQTSMDLQKGGEGDDW